MRLHSIGNGFVSMLFFLLVSIVLIVSVVVYMVTQRVKYMETLSNQQITVSQNIQKSASPQDYFSCINGGTHKKTTGPDPFEKGLLIFKAKDGTTEETILKTIKPLGYNMTSLQSPWGYSGIDRSTLYIKHALTPENIKSLITPIIAKFSTEETTTGFYYSAADILFTRVLTKQEQDGIDKSFVQLKLRGDIQDYGWNIAPRQLYGFLAVPIGHEEEYITKLNNLGIFDCVSRNFAPVDDLPVVPLAQPKSL